MPFMKKSRISFVDPKTGLPRKEPKRTGHVEPYESIENGYKFEQKTRVFEEKEREQKRKVRAKKMKKYGDWASNFQKKMGGFEFGGFNQGLDFGWDPMGGFKPKKRKKKKKKKPKYVVVGGKAYRRG